MKRIVALLLAICMCFGFTACKGISSEDVAPITATEEAAREDVKNAKLSDEVMYEAICDYFEAFNSVFVATGENIFTQVVMDGKKVNVRITQPVLDSMEKETGEMMASDMFVWDSIEEGYAYLYEMGIVDLEGGLTLTADEMISGIVPDESSSVKKPVPNEENAGTDEENAPDIPQ